MLKNKRIFFCVTNDLTHDRRMARICGSLAEAGANVTLVGRRLKNSRVFHSSNFRGVRLRCIFNKGPLFYFEYNVHLLFYLLFQNFDAACACDLDTALAVRIAANFRKRKSIYDAHEFFTEVPELTGRPRVKHVWEWIAKITIPQFQLRYTVGNELANLMSIKYGVSFELVRNIAPAPSSSENTIAVDKRKNIILYQGALNVGRGLKECIHAMTRLPLWELWLAGEGDITKELQDLTRSLNLSSSVQFLGWVNPENLPHLLSQAKLGINMREIDSLNDYYSLPNKFFDCIHAGLPSINMNYPEYRSINEKYHCCILVDDVSVDSIVNKVTYLEKHPEDLIKMSAACRQAALKFTWKNESSNLLKLYNQLLA